MAGQHPVKQNRKFAHGGVTNKYIKQEILHGRVTVTQTKKEKIHGRATAIFKRDLSALFPPFFVDPLPLSLLLLIKKSYTKKPIGKCSAQ